MSDLSACDGEEKLCPPILLVPPYLIVFLPPHGTQQTPTLAPTVAPTTRSPTVLPTGRPTRAPTLVPTAVPWVVDSLCKDCESATIFDKIRKVRPSLGGHRRRGVRGGKVIAVPCGTVSCYAKFLSTPPSHQGHVPLRNC